MCLLIQFSVKKQQHDNIILTATDLQMIKSFREKLKEYKSAFYHGKAFRRMELGRFESAAKILESICHENPRKPGNEISYFFIGQCYFRMGKIDLTINWLSKAYEIFNIKIIENKSYRYLRNYRDMLELYCKALRIKGDGAVADKLIYENDFGS